MKHLFVLLFPILSIAIACTRHDTAKNEAANDLPSLLLTLPPGQYESILKDKKLKVGACALLHSADNDTMYDGDLAYVKTRGNQTWEVEKKAYTIELPVKTRLLGLYKSRTFVLLANALDESHIRNAVSFDLARLMSLPTPAYAFLKLYVNGEYKGLYQMTNKVKIERHTLNITDLGKSNKQANPRRLEDYEAFEHIGNLSTVCRGFRLENDPADITGGYLLEYGNGNESAFVSNAGDVVGIRSPKYASVKQVRYISDLYNQFESALLAKDGTNPHTGSHYSEYIDTESFARYYLLNEIVLNHDGGMHSFYMYKDSDSINPKLYAGPAWDFDKSLASPYWENDVLVHNEIFIGAPFGKDTRHHTRGILFHLMQHEDFQNLVNELYINNIYKLCKDYLDSGRIDSLSRALEQEAEKDNLLWGRRKSNTYHDAVAMVKDFLGDRIEFLSWYYATPEEKKVPVSYKTSHSYGMYFHREINMYYPLDTPIYPPASLWPYFFIYNNTPVAELYYEGTDSIVKPGTVFRSPKKLELRARKPTWKEVQARRVKKKLSKLANLF